MPKTYGKSTGPWLFVGSKSCTTRHLGGRRFRARLVSDRVSGPLLNVAWAGHYRYGRSIVIGWMPDHRKAGCTLSVGMLYDHKAGPPAVDTHRCWARRLPEFELGKDPRELRKVAA
jgi:hypothetical protein